ncbi:hypothetical protein MNBD_GAMMA02-1683 [hydrothermal vent metagenome]|uniref:Uncharacterized protein n=1 Tax=hydrothermal vent metagenome TaxID=652676 RepID=A0A3B0W2C6_9ZZZZ
MINNTQPQSTDKKIVSTALKNATESMGLSQTQVASILMVDKSTLSRSLKSGIEPLSLKGQVSLLIIRMYRSLFALSGDNKKFMNHFLQTPNKAFGAAPLELLKTLDGLVQVNQYLDAMRGKI